MASIILIGPLADPRLRDALAALRAAETPLLVLIEPAGLGRIVLAVDGEVDDPPLAVALRGGLDRGRPIVPAQCLPRA